MSIVKTLGSPNLTLNSIVNLYQALNPKGGLSERHPDLHSEIQIPELYVGDFIHDT